MVVWRRIGHGSGLKLSWVDGVKCDIESWGQRWSVKCVEASNYLKWPQKYPLSYWKWGSSDWSSQLRYTVIYMLYHNIINMQVPLHTYNPQPYYVCDHFYGWLQYSCGWNLGLNLLFLAPWCCYMATSYMIKFLGINHPLFHTYRNRCRRWRTYILNWVNIQRLKYWRQQVSVQALLWNGATSSTSGSCSTGLKQDIE